MNTYTIEVRPGFKYEVDAASESEAVAMATQAYNDEANSISSAGCSDALKKSFEDSCRMFVQESDMVAQGPLSKHVLRSLKEVLASGLFRDDWENGKHMVTDVYLFVMCKCTLFYCGVVY